MNVDLHFKLELQELKQLINDLFNYYYLNEKAVEVIKMRYGFYDGKIYKYEEIGKELGLTIQAVYSFEVRALTKLRKHYKTKALAHYLGNEGKIVKK